MAERRKKKKRLMSGFLALLTAVSALLCQPGTVLAQELAEETNENSTGETVVLEGIALNKTSLVMKTGEQKSLTARFLPENTTEQPEIVWSSDDTEVAEVTGDGLTAVVTAPDGAGGTAVITASAGGFTAKCPVLVTVQDSMLESVLFMQNSSGSNRYELTEGTPGSREYTLRIPENTNVVYVRPQLRDDISETASITAKFADVNTGGEVSVNLPVDESTSLSSSTTGRLIKAYNTEPRELLIEVQDGERTEVYQIHVVRGSYLGSFTLTDDTGENLSYSPEFKKSIYEYSIHVPSSTTQLRINLTPAEKSSTNLTVNGETAEDGSYTLPLSVGKVTAVMRAGDGVWSVPYDYTLTIYVDEVCHLKVNVKPADAVFAVYNENQEQIDPKDGLYELIKGSTYTYTVSGNGYVSQSGSFTIDGDEEMTFELEKVSDSQLEELDAEWGGYWKNEDNQNIVDSETPSSLANTELLWKQKYGSNGDNNDSVSDGILVENYICCFQGNMLMYLDKTTGETVMSTKMTARGNSSFNKPLYAAGMIFVPLNNGRLQAFNAKTLESLWVYIDTVGGNAATALRYDSGYLYVGFADGNLVCLSVSDEDPGQTNEEKSAVWRKYDSNGYYRTGVYTGETYLYACGRSGSVYCLDKKTGETVQRLALPSEAGAASTAVCYADGRIYFATEKGYLYSYALAEDGKIDTTSVRSMNLGGTIYGTPLIYKGRIYIGSATMDSYGVVLAPYYLNVVQIGDTGELSLAYRMEIGACPKSTGTLSTAYEQKDGYVYVYFTTDSPTGNLYLLKDQSGLTAPGEESGLFYQQNEVSCNGSGSILADGAGNLYFRYESAWLFALKSTDLYIENVEISGENVVLDEGRAFDRQAENHKVILDGGSDLVTMTFTVSEGTTVSVDGREGTTQEILLKDGRAEAVVLLTKGEQSRIYQFFIRQRSSDASLEKLQVSYSPVVTVMEMELEPAFVPEITSYNSSIYGNGNMQSYYVWPMLPEDSEATIKMTVVSGVSGATTGQEIVPMTVHLTEGERLRYQVRPAGTEAATVQITVTAEDGTTQKVYRLSMFRNNDSPKLTASALTDRQKSAVTIRVNANIDGYLYYLAETKAGTAGMPTSSRIRTDGKRVAISAGENTVTIDDVDPEESVLYLYEMSYAQRFSSGIRIDIPAYSEKEEPVEPQGSGDINGDGTVNIADVSILLDAVTAGQSLPLQAADLTGDGRVTIGDVSALLDRVTSGG